MSTTAPVTIAPSTVKSTLARLLSTESIAVIHDPKITTAFFDLKARSLHLPVWKDVTNALYDMLVGHEVAHALWTGADDWRTGIETVQSRTGVSRDTAAGTLNVVEDARIERMIKSKFPGLRRDFHSGYGTLHARGFFGDVSRIGGLGFADRVNLHFKIGLHLGTPVPFSAAETAILAAVECATTWSDVVEAAIAVIGHAQFTKQQQQQQSGGEPVAVDGNSTDGGEPGDDSNNGAGEADGNSTTGTGETGEGKDAASPGAGADTDRQNNSGGEDTTASHGKVTQHTWGTDPGAPVTDSALERAIREQLVDTSTAGSDSPVYTAVVPEGGIQCPAWRVVDFPGVIERIDRMESEIRADAETRKNSTHACLLEALRTPVRSRFHTEATNSMFTAFDRRKAADLFRRSRISNSGALDPLRMNQYRWSEDIFRKNTRLAEGKNHGIVIALDWSGSMGGIMRETIGQLFIITDFCRRAGIPFEVYSFSDVVWSGRKTTYINVGNSDIRAIASTLTLANWLSSRMTKPQYERMKSALAAFPIWNYSNHSSGLGLGSTPTTAATFALVPIVEEFVKRNRIQIPHVMFLTDGEPSDTIEFYSRNNSGSSMGFKGFAGIRANVVLRDASTGVAYSLMSGYRDDHRTQDAAYNTCPDTSYLEMTVSNWGRGRDSRLGWIGRDMIRRRTGAAIHWIGLSTNAKRSHMSGFVEALGSAYSRDGYARGTAVGWDSAVVARAGDFRSLTNDSETVIDDLEANRAAKFDNLLEGMRTAKRTASGGFSAAAVKSLASAMAMRNSAKTVATIIGEVVAV
jgi:hypothetical protein